MSDLQILIAAMRLRLLEMESYAEKEAGNFFGSAMNQQAKGYKSALTMVERLAEDNKPARTLSNKP